MRITREIVKTYILAFLILTAIVLTGNLWMVEGYRLPFVFGEKKTIERIEIYNEFFKPVRIVVNYGQEKHWIFYPYSADGQSEEYSALWNDLARPVIKAAFEQQKQPVKIESNISFGEWEKLSSQRTFKFEFKAGIKNELLTMFLNISKFGAQGVVDGVEEIVISPWESVNESSMVLYIKDTAGKIHRLIAVLDTDQYRKSFDEQIKKINSDANITRYLTLGEQNQKMAGNVSLASDIMVVLPGKSLKNLKYPEIEFHNEFDIDIRKIEGVSKLAEEFLGEDKDNYKRHTDSSGMVSFININNERIFRIYPDGFVECYNTVYEDIKEKSDLRQAFTTAVDFMYKYGGMPEGIYPYLSQILFDGKNEYTFKFDYFAGGLPVVTTRPYRDGKKLDCAVEIRILGRNVESYLRYIKRPEMGRVSSINTYSIMAMDSLFNGDVEIKGSKLYNIFLGYNASKTTGTYPSWFFDFREGNPLYSVDAVKK